MPHIKTGQETLARKTREMTIHPTAIVDKHAQLDTGVSVGPFTVIGPKVAIGKDTQIAGHATITGKTTIGRRNRIYPYAFIGTDPQDINYRGEDTRLVIGDDNIIREYVTISVATTKYDWITRVGNGNMLMSYCHVAHDCEIGNATICANCLNMSGHVKIEDGAAIGGIVGIHQFVTIGKYAFIGGLSRITQDVPPFLITEGNHAKVRGVNTVGMRRNNIDEKSIAAVEETFKALYVADNGVFSQRLDELEKRADLTPDVRYLVQFQRNSINGVQGRAREIIRKQKKG